MERLHFLMPAVLLVSVAIGFTIAFCVSREVEPCYVTNKVRTGEGCLYVVDWDTCTLTAQDCLPSEWECPHGTCD